jgi:hypothetical protein
MSPVVVVGLAAIDASVVAQAAYAYSDFRRRAERAVEKRK